MRPDQRVIGDLVILGRGAPDTMRDGRVTICVAGWSPTLGFIRVYPTRTSSPLQQWNVVSVPVERNPNDNRPESWKIQGSSGEWDRLDRKIRVERRVTRAERLQLVPPLTTGCVKDLNEKRISLGIIHPSSLEGYLSERSDVDPSVQQTLLGETLPKTKANFQHQPRLRFRCESCRQEGGHDQQIIEWGCYVWFGKSPGRESQVFENLRVSDPEYEKYLLVGNQNNHRTSYVVIGVIRWKKSPSSGEALD